MSRRGASMVEVLVAGAVLLAGLLGIIQLMLLGMSQFRNADVRQSSEFVVQSTLADYRARGYSNLDAGVYTLTPAVDDVGRPYTRQATVTDVGDGGIGAYRVDVAVGWSQRVGVVGLSRESRGSLVVSEVPDASF